VSCKTCQEVEKVLINLSKESEKYEKMAKWCCVGLAITAAVLFSTALVL